MTQGSPRAKMVGVQRVVCILKDYLKYKYALSLISGEKYQNNCRVPTLKVNQLMCSCMSSWLKEEGYRYTCNIIHP